MNPRWRSAFAAAWVSLGICAVLRWGFANDTFDGVFGGVALALGCAHLWALRRGL